MTEETTTTDRHGSDPLTTAAAENCEDHEGKCTNDDTTNTASLQAIFDDFESKTGRLRKEGDDLRAKNEQLGKRNGEIEARIKRIEAELGLDATADRQGVADD